MRHLPLPTILLATAVSAQAATPQLSTIRPVGAQRGTEVEVTLSGARLGDAQEILYFQPGISTVSLAKVDDNNVKAKLKIAPDCPLGLHDIRVRCATGVSELRTFSVGALPETSEVEPNNDFSAPQPVPFNAVVNGVADNEDVDYFVVEVKKGERITVEVEGIRLGITQFDPYVAIMDTKRFELASSDDAALVWQDAEASVIAPEDGRYIIQVRESAYAGNGSCLYRLHVGNFPRATATVPAGGKLGEKVALKWIGDVAGDRDGEVALPAEPDPSFGVVNQDEKGVSPYPNTFRLTKLDNVVETEPNNDQNTATPFTAPMALNGVIDKPGDVDQFVFKAEKGQVFDIHCYARRIRSPLDPVMYLGKKGGGAILGADDAVGPDSYFRFQAPESAEYVIWLVDHLGQGGKDYAYRIEVAPIEPKLTTYLTTEQVPLGTGNIAVAVPKGNRQALLVYASRIDWGGDLKIDVPGLPPGVTIQADTMPANQPVVPVLFLAAPDAPVGGVLTRPVGTPVDPNIKLASQDFTATSVLVLGANNVDVWHRVVDKVPVAVTEECPYTLEVVEPKVPLVRGGSMGLKVRAIRKEGFKAPISVSFPWLPPGIGASGGVAIPEGQDEAVIPMNADGGAELRTWKLVVNGYSGVPSGPIMVSSQLFNLAIAAPFVNLAYQNAACEQGKETDLLVKVAKAADFPGEAQVTLIGLPNKATTDVKTITQDTTEIVFHIKTAPDTPAGNHANLFCQVVITMNGEPILHNLGTGALRVDVPIPPKASDPAPMPMPEAQPAAPAAKPLSRLEMLRLEQAEKARKAAEPMK
jgi:hypothetical protein